MKRGMICLVYVSNVSEVRNLCYLLHQRRENSCDHEDGKYHILQPLLCSIRMKETKANKQRRRNTQQQFTVDISRCSPVLLEDSNSDFPQLAGERHCELGVRTLVCFCCLGAHFGLDSRELVLDFFCFIGVLPHFMPIFRRFSRGSRADHRQHW
jgi:hypothetical protein